jgi:hypothetical protein
VKVLLKKTKKEVNTTRFSTAPNFERTFETDTLTGNTNEACAKEKSGYNYHISSS